jgi:serine/threonine protein kinase
MIGTSLNQYRITAVIGAGGMGEVFRARDTKLNREVAIKVLPKVVVANPDRLRRFEQEYKTLAALNHPNVLTIHEAGVHDGLPYLVSELLEGKSLREVLNSTGNSGLSVEKATEYSLQIAHGLEAAYGNGIVHRDLKPENIFVTKDGYVKILDFGLAKLRVAGSQLTASPSIEETEWISSVRADAHTDYNPTEPGTVLGTPSYMSPEQVKGEPVDHRADIFAFGCVLYEMLSGARAFRRKTPIESMSAVLNESPPDPSTRNPKVTASLDRIVQRCIEKVPDRRFQSPYDLGFALENAGLQERQSHPSKGYMPARSRLSWSIIIPWVIAAVCLAAFLLATCRHKLPGP